MLDGQRPLECDLGRAWLVPLRGLPGPYPSRSGSLCLGLNLQWGSQLERALETAPSSNPILGLAELFLESACYFPQGHPQSGLSGPWLGEERA